MDQTLNLRVALTDTLQTAQHGLAAARLQDAEKLMSALENGRFQFAAEPWHDVTAAKGHHGAQSPRELLLRPRNEKGEDFAPFPGISAMNDMGLSVSLDKVLVSAMLAQDTGHIAINIAAQTAESPEFWEWVNNDLPQKVAPVTPSNIVFEITEDGMADRACIAHMQDLKTQGYRFAIDDFTSSTFDETRLKNLAAITDFVKISGPSIEAGLKQPERLRETIDKIKAICPQAKLVAEWVKTPQEALRLQQDFGIDSAQGRSLPKTAHEFVLQLNAAATATTAPKGPGMAP